MSRVMRESPLTICECECLVENNRVPAVSRVDPNVFAALDYERKLLVGRDLIVLFENDQVFELWLSLQIILLRVHARIPDTTPTQNS